MWEIDMSFFPYFLRLLNVNEANQVTNVSVRREALDGADACYITQFYDATGRKTFKPNSKGGDTPLWRKTVKNIVSHFFLSKSV